MPRVTIIAAHPDDEVIGAGGRLPYLDGANIVHVTDGAPRDMTDAIANGFTTREAYAAARAVERTRALALTGIAADRILDIALVDQEASFALVELTHHVAKLLWENPPDVVLTHAYEGGHPDHDATAFAVHGAVDLVRRRGARAPAIIEFAGYHWRDGAMRTGGFLPHPSAHERRVSLGNRERRLKDAMFACYATQRRVLAAFSSDGERFRHAPTYDFTAPPHEGRLFYEWFEWGVTGAAWRRLAEAALVELESLTTQC